MAPVLCWWWHPPTGGRSLTADAVRLSGVIPLHACGAWGAGRRDHHSLAVATGMSQSWAPWQQWRFRMEKEISDVIGGTVDGANGTWLACGEAWHTGRQDRHSLAAGTGAGHRACGSGGASAQRRRSPLAALQAVLETMCDGAKYARFSHKALSGLEFVTIQGC